MRKTILFAILLMASPAFAQHGIKLTWTQGTCTSCTLTMNTVYRGSTLTGPFTAIFTSTSPITSYLDPLTSSNQGTQACYVVTVWTVIESNQSNAACQTFPTQAQAPSNVTATQQ